jgi:hypothetical protein
VDCPCISSYGGSGDFPLLSLRQVGIAPERIDIKALLDPQLVDHNDLAHINVRFSVRAVDAVSVSGASTDFVFSIGMLMPFAFRLLMGDGVVT